MAVNSSRSMNAELSTGAVDHTIRLRQGEDRGGPIDEANYYNHLLSGSAAGGIGGTAIDLTGDFLVADYLTGIVKHPRH